MLFGGVFQNSSASLWLCNFPRSLPRPQNRSHDPPGATPAGFTLRGFRLFRVRSPLLAESLLFSSPPGTEMVHFPGFALLILFIEIRVTSYGLAGFPHSETSGSRVVCTSPELIAAYHVLHRLHAPRHPPCALSSLTIKFAHRKTLQHIFLTPSLFLMPSASLKPFPSTIISLTVLSLTVLASLKHPASEELNLFWDHCLFDFQRALTRNTLTSKAITAKLN